MNILVSFCLCTCVISICLVVKSLGYNGWRSLILFHIPNNFLMRLNQFILCQNYMIFINTFNFTQWHACDSVSHCVFKWHFSEKMWSLVLSVCILAIWSLSGYFFFFWYLCQFCTMSASVLDLCFPEFLFLDGSNLELAKSKFVWDLGGRSEGSDILQGCPCFHLVLSFLHYTEILFMMASPYDQLWS